MAGKPDLKKLIIDAATAPIAELGIELIDVEWIREGQAKILRLFIDKKGGVDLDDCTAVSRLVDTLIDERLQIHEHDYLEVSSPGLERPLKTERDFIRYQGEWVELTGYKAIGGQKKVQGKLCPCTDTDICLEMEDGTMRQYPRNEVARVRRTIRF